MIRAIKVHPRGTWSYGRVVATLTVAWESQPRGREVLSSDDGHRFVLALDTPHCLAAGEALELEGGALVEVRAAPEPLARIRSNDPLVTARLAWHIGRRKVPVQVLPDGALCIREDRALERLAQGLGARVRHCHAPFVPGGAG